MSWVENRRESIGAGPRDARRRQQAPQRLGGGAEQEVTVRRGHLPGAGLQLGFQLARSPAGVALESAEPQRLIVVQLAGALQAGGVAEVHAGGDLAFRL